VTWLSGCSLIYGAKGYFLDQLEYRDFVTSIFARRGTEATTFRAALNILAKVFNYDESVQSLLFLVMQHCELPHKLSALEGLVNSRDYTRISSRVKEELFSPALLDFRLYLAQKAYEEPKRALMYNFLNNSAIVLSESLRSPFSLLDFGNPIDDDELVKLIAYLLTIHTASTPNVKTRLDTFEGNLKDLRRRLREDSRQFKSALKASAVKRHRFDQGLPSWVNDLSENGRILIQQLALAQTYSGIQFQYAGPLASSRMTWTPF